jgi:recombinational DNA repair protein (RecF pathway)
VPGVTKCSECGKDHGPGTYYNVKGGVYCVWCYADRCYRLHGGQESKGAP